jgi:hypothetical protein
MTIFIILSFEEISVQNIKSKCSYMATHQFLGMFTKLQDGTVSFVMFVQLSM